MTNNNSEIHKLNRNISALTVDEYDIINSLTTSYCSQSTHKKCNDIIGRIIKLCEKQKVISYEFVFWFDKYFNNFHRCILSNPIIYEKVIDTFIKYCPKKYIDLAQIFSTFLLHKGHITDYIISNSFKHHYFTITKIAAITLLDRSPKNTQYLLKCIDATSENLKYAADKGILSLVGHLLFNKVTIDSSCINIYITSYRHNIVEQFINYGLFTEINIKSACLCANNKIIEYCLTKKIFKPTTDYLNLVINSTSSVNIVGKNEIINSFIDHGYKLSYTDVCNITSIKCMINNLNEQDITLESKFIQICTKYNYFPYEKTLKLTSTYQDMMFVCEKNGPPELINCLINNGIQPDIKCLNAFMVVKKDIGAQLIIGSIMKTPFNYKNIQPVNKEQEQFATQYIKKKTKRINNLRYRNRDFVESEYEEDSDDKKLLSKNIDFTDDTISLPNTKKYNYFTIPTYNNVNYDKIKLNKDISKLFNINDNSNITFLDLRKIFINYIISNKLIDTNDKTVIKIDSKLATLIKSHKINDKYISFNQINMFIYHMINQ